MSKVIFKHNPESLYKEIAFVGRPRTFGMDANGQLAIWYEVDPDTVGPTSVELQTPPIAGATRAQSIREVLPTARWVGMVVFTGPNQPFDDDYEIVASCTDRGLCWHLVVRELRVKDGYWQEAGGSPGL